LSASSDEEAKKMAIEYISEVLDVRLEKLVSARKMLDEFLKGISDG
jgi:hypothetical protein